ncbi:hypothetical protein RHMOL_Rhmol02G0074300 [Rhododendron molle]|uniref:Uncharacterized protein n=1 Tax=Rhododendron molle TaxID=49168 RepID=A0ACC0PP98_RHOML|nr:hypothetical protein RHMOL_Rhmol02G0074300 [Rhododendron molle]
MAKPHFIIVTLPTQGHLNPCFQLAKRLIQMDVQVTFVISVHAERRISRNDFQTPDGFKFTTYSDGYDEGRKPGNDLNHFFSVTRSNSSQRLREIIATSSEEGCPVTCLIYNFLLPWAAKVARDCHVCSSVLWIQPAMVLDIYHYYFNGYKDVIMENYKDPSWSIELPGLPLLHACDLRTLYFHPSRYSTSSRELPYYHPLHYSEP